MLAELSKRIGLDTGVLTSSMAFARLVEAVPFYRGLTLEAIGGRGVRWPEREEALGPPEALVEDWEAMPTAESRARALSFVTEWFTPEEIAVAGRLPAGAPATDE